MSDTMRKMILFATPVFSGDLRASISNVAWELDVSGESITVTFTTDINSGTGLEWGTTTSYGTAAINPPESVTSHTITVNEFDNWYEGQSYHFRSSAISGSQVTYSDDQTINSHRMLLMEYFTVSAMQDMFFAGYKTTRKTKGQQIAQLLFWS